MTFRIMNFMTIIKYTLLLVINEQIDIKDIKGSHF